MFGSVRVIGLGSVLVHQSYIYQVEIYLGYRKNHKSVMENYFDRSFSKSSRLLPFLIKPERLPPSLSRQSILFVGM